MSWLVTPSNLLVDDQDALTYLTAVEAADGQALESGVRLAVNAFVKGCKNDGIWPAIKASCILAGARTLTGALVPLLGTAPTNFNFVSGDYNRETGLAGDGSTKYLNSNRNNNADPQNSQHLAVFVSALPSDTIRRSLIGCGVGDAGSSQINTTAGNIEVRSRTSTNFNSGQAASVGLSAISRSSPDFYIARNASANATVSIASQAPLDQTINVFRRSNTSPAGTDARLAFYSIGESLDLALLDARVTTLVNAFAAAIP
jgi:hypothetical protein